ncbi:hypothetical protein NNJEOMEG_02573 [Fundidesulfovibrio magnetotacticus]|uniref:Uncharacterized protein n=1 Tax=Fundidesulfovibrio magnetotacticus TaxID=2730080 RepID=A0A6V8LY33_9BACT|nr:hypothetical protein NNJEOMEG_02573 [Fundidesulfovibrio magnetotacticus]
MVNSKLPHRVRPHHVYINFTGQFRVIPLLIQMKLDCSIHIGLHFVS